MQGLAEMRRLIGILRERGGDPETAVAPTLDGLGSLVAGARVNGLDVTLDADPGPLPAPVELAAYRIVQESLTNALKHASPGRVAVSLARPGGLPRRHGHQPLRRPRQSPRAGFRRRSGRDA